MKLFRLDIILIFVCITSIIPINLFAQEYQSLIKENRFNEAIPIIASALQTIYSQRSLDKIIPSRYVAIEKIEEGIDLKKLFFTRKIQPFFIEDNIQLYNLHKDIAYCYQNTHNYTYAIQHYFQALRFTIISEKDHSIFYALAQLFKKLNKYHAYLLYLEEAYEIFPHNYDYSLELALELAKTQNKKKALFHLNRYIQAKGNSVNPDIYRLAANCYESLGDYLQASRFYQLYLSQFPTDFTILFSLGYLAFTKLSDFTLSKSLLTKGLMHYNPDDYYRRGMSHIILGDIALLDLNYNDAIYHYNETIKVNEALNNQIEKKRAKVEEIQKKINTIKSTLLETKDITLYPEYQSLLDELGNTELELRYLKHEYSKLSIGNVYFKLAQCYEYNNEFINAIQWYSKAISVGTKTHEALQKIEKLQLKISRGF